MKTEDLISLMTHDARVGVGYGRIMRVALWAGLAVSLLLLLATVGLRHNLLPMLGTARVSFKIMVTIVLTLVAARAVLRIGRPGDTMRSSTLLLMLPLAMLAVAVTVELFVIPSAAWQSALFGQHAFFCLVFIPVLSAGPFGFLLYGLRRGAPAHPGIAGGFAGLSSGALGAAVYALHCPDDSPLFVGTWYFLSIFLVASAGFFIGQRLLRW